MIHIIFKLIQINFICFFIILNFQWLVIPVFSSTDPEMQPGIHCSLFVSYALKPAVDQRLPPYLAYGGSATQIGQNVFLTNAHNIVNDQIDKDSAYYEDYPAKIIVTIANGEKIVCEDYYAHENFENVSDKARNHYDYALLRAKVSLHSLSQQYDFAYLSNNFAVGDNQGVRIIGYKHLNEGMRKEYEAVNVIIMRENYSQNNSNFIAYGGGFSYLALNDLLGFSGANVHLCDTTALYEKLNIIAMHTYSYTRAGGMLVGLGIKITNSVYTNLVKWNDHLMKECMWRKLDFSYKTPPLDKNWSPVLLSIQADNDVFLREFFMPLFIEILIQKCADIQNITGNSLYNTDGISQLFQFFTLSKSGLNILQECMPFVQLTPYNSLCNLEETDQSFLLFDELKSKELTIDGINALQGQNPSRSILVIVIGTAGDSQIVHQKLVQRTRRGLRYYRIGREKFINEESQSYYEQIEKSLTLIMQNWLSLH